MAVICFRGFLFVCFFFQNQDEHISSNFRDSPPCLFASCVSPGDSRAHNALHCILGNQHYLRQLFQLQPRLLSRVSPGHCSFCQHHLHCHVTCCSGCWPSAAAFFHQVYAHALMDAGADSTQYCWIIYYSLHQLVIGMRKLCLFLLLESDWWTQWKGKGLQLRLHCDWLCDACVLQSQNLCLPTIYCYPLEQWVTRVINKIYNLIKVTTYHDDFWLSIHLLSSYV